jgi:hypothetical protein
VKRTPDWALEDMNESPDSSAPAASSDPIKPSWSDIKDNVSKVLRLPDSGAECYDSISLFLTGGTGLLLGPPDYWQAQGTFAGVSASLSVDRRGNVYWHAGGSFADPVYIAKSRKLFGASIGHYWAIKDGQQVHSDKDLRKVLTGGSTAVSGGPVPGNLCGVKSSDGYWSGGATISASPFSWTAGGGEKVGNLWQLPLLNRVPLDDSDDN